MGALGVTTCSLMSCAGPSGDLHVLQGTYRGMSLDRILAAAPRRPEEEGEEVPIIETESFKSLNFSRRKTKSSAC